MIKINVIDFDKTLIPFDSFRVFVLKEIKRFRISFLVFTILRLLKLITAEVYKSQIIKIVLKESPGNFGLASFCNYLIKNIDSNVSDMIKERSDNNTLNILCSASPDFYVSIVAEKLGWKGYGSKYNNGNQFLHLYGERKKEFIINEFPSSEYIYKFSISDGISDLPLLELFEEYKLVE